MKIIAINDGHNASIVLFEDGELKLAVQEERFTRIKNQHGFPNNALNWILQESNNKINDIDNYVLVSNYLPINTADDRETRMYAYKKEANLKQNIKNFAKKFGARKIASYFNNENRMKYLLDKGVAKEKIKFMEHHLAHAASAYFSWANFNEPILILTNDGAGDDLSATVSVGKKGEIKRLAEINMEDSIGELWALITAMMGMVPLEHEYKLMGLAPYAPKKGEDIVKDIFHNYYEFTNDGLTWKVKDGLPKINYAYEYFREKLEFKRFDWIGAGLQKFTEEFLVQWVRNAIKKTGIKKIALAGGTFMNVKVNKVISELSEVEEIFITPSCGDDTLPIGAAYYEYFNSTKQFNQPLRDLYLGRKFSNDEVLQAFKEYKFKNKFKIEKIENISKEVANLLVKGEVVAWFQGREEFGARALGARSIIADPTKPKVIKIINEMIKSRDFWMPFAASMIEEGAKKYLYNPKNIPSPYMIITFDTTEYADEIEAGRHPYDETCRPQVVYEDWNKKYYDLIAEFSKLTGRYGVLNTSFNLHGLPIASSPEDAFLVLDNSGLKYLAIEDYLVIKETN